MVYGNASFDKSIVVLFLFLIMVVFFLLDFTSNMNHRLANGHLACHMMFFVVVFYHSFQQHIIAGVSKSYLL